MAEENGNGKGELPNETPAIIQIVITLRNGQAELSGNIPEAPVIGLGLLADAQIKLIGFYHNLRLKEQKTHRDILQPNGNKFLSGLRNFLGDK